LDSGGELSRKLRPTPGCNAKEEEEYNNNNNNNNNGVGDSKVII
jgi:hypothetical protein